MRLFSSIALAVFTAGILSSQAAAGSQNYCELFAKDFADGRTTDVDLWQKAYHNAFNDCMNQYTAAAPVAAPKKPLQKQAALPITEPETSAEATEAAAVVKPKPELEPGTEAWNEYCAAKYKSFNPDTGTYNSNTGKERRCTVTQ
jgi:hypothetical protein